MAPYTKMPQRHFLCITTNVKQKIRLSKVFFCPSIKCLFTLIFLDGYECEHALGGKQPTSGSWFSPSHLTLFSCSFFSWPCFTYLFPHRVEAQGLWELPLLSASSQTRSAGSPSLKSAHQLSNPRLEFLPTSKFTCASSVVE
jgi:hypothetical protein